MTKRHCRESIAPDTGKADAADFNKAPPVDLFVVLALSGRWPRSLFVATQGSGI